MEVDNNDNTGERLYQDEENIHKNKVSQVDTENFGDEERTMIEDVLYLMKDNSGIELGGINKVDRCVIAEWSRNRNCILKHIGMENITVMQIS